MAESQKHYNHESKEPDEEKARNEVREKANPVPRNFHENALNGILGGFNAVVSPSIKLVLRAGFHGP